MNKVKGSVFLFKGKNQNYFWISGYETDQKTLWSAVEEIITNIQGKRIAVKAFDGGSFIPTPEELKLGWKQIKDIAVSPQVALNLELPYDNNYDEWYIFDDNSNLQNSLKNVSEYDFFVNYQGWRIWPQEQLNDAVARDQYIKNFTSGYDDRADLQKRFWSQIYESSPFAYLSDGPFFTFLTIDRIIFESVCLILDKKSVK